MAINMKLEPSESMYLWRRRRRLGQQEAAQYLGVTPARLRDWENDRDADGMPPEVANLTETSADIERYVILRRRAEMTIKELSKKLGVTKAWVVRMETGAGDPSLLRKYWDDKTKGA